MRVGVIALMHESNTFVGSATTFADFEADLLVRGKEMRRRMEGAHHETGGFFQGLDEAGVEAVPLFAARALPGGVIEASAARRLTAELLQEIDDAGPLDGILAAPHGAAVAENEPDLDGAWLTAVRSRIGSQVPLVATLDLHANVSSRMATACNALVAYRTNPHLDQRDRGREAAALLVRTLRSEVRPSLAYRLLPLAVNIAQQATAASPCRELYTLVDAVRCRPGVLSASVVLGFPYADVQEMGASVVVVGESHEIAEAHASEIAAWWWGNRGGFTATLPGPAEVVRSLGDLPWPVCLLDVGDNVGGGSPADGTTLAHELCQSKLGPAVVCLADPESVKQAWAAGVGAHVRLRVGGKTDKYHGAPLESEFVVRGLYSGKFTESEPRHGGITEFDQGPSAVVEAEHLTVLLTTRRMAPFSLQQLRSCEIRPEMYRVLVAKGVHAPVAAYAPVCRTLIRVGTPGVTTADLSGFDYRSRRKPMYPFEAHTVWAG